jgi:hypothetical protein
LPRLHAHLIAVAFTGADLVTFQNVGHIPQEELHDESAMAVHEFFYRLLEGRPCAAVACCAGLNQTVSRLR